MQLVKRMSDSAPGNARAKQCRGDLPNDSGGTAGAKRAASGAQPPGGTCNGGDSGDLELRSTIQNERGNERYYT